MLGQEEPTEMRTAKSTRWVGYHDPNRDWGWNCKPDYDAARSFRYPFTLPENRSVMEFVMKHPEYAGSNKVFHNSEGMIFASWSEEDIQYLTIGKTSEFYDAIGEKKARRVNTGLSFIWLSTRICILLFGGRSYDCVLFGNRGIFTYSMNMTS